MIYDWEMTFFSMVKSKYIKSFCFRQTFYKFGSNNILQYSPNVFCSDHNNRKCVKYKPVRLQSFCLVKVLFYENLKSWSTSVMVSVGDTASFKALEVFGDTRLRESWDELSNLEGRRKKNAIHTNAFETHCHRKHRILRISN